MASEQDINTLEQWRRNRDAPAGALLPADWTVSDPQRTENGSIFVSAWTPSRAFVAMPYGLRVRPGLSLSCLSGDLSILLYIDPGYLEQDAIPVRWSVDDQALPDAAWTARRTSYNVFGLPADADPEDVVDRLVSGQRLDMTLMTEAADIDVSFELDGFPAALNQLRQACSD